MTRFVNFLKVFLTENYYVSQLLRINCLSRSVFAPSNVTCKKYIKRLQYGSKIYLHNISYFIFIGVACVVLCKKECKKGNVIDFTTGVLLWSAH